MKRAFKYFLLPVLCFGLVWALILPRWSAQNRDIGQFEILAYLVGLPLGLLALGMFASWAWRRRGRRDAEPAPQASETAAPVAQAATPARSWQVLATGMVCAAGANSDEIAGRLAQDLDGIIDLDPMLRNRDGFPIMSARVTTLDDSALETWLARRQAVVDPAVQRALALAQTAFDEIVDQLGPILAAAEVPSLAIHVLANDDASNPTLVTDYLEQRARSQFAKIESLSCESHEHLDALQAALDAAAVEGRELQLVIAARSSLSENAVDRLDATGQLFSAQNQHGFIPGEAACALLLADGDAYREHALARVSLPTRTPKPTHAGRIEHRVLAQLLEQSLTTRAIAAESVAAVYCDTARPGDRAAEAASAMTDVLSHLDPVAQRHNVDALCGATGMVAPLMALALATRATAESGQPNLVAWLSAPDARAATAVEPIVIASPEPADATAQTQSA